MPLTIRPAVVLATPSPGFDPLDRVAGLPLAVRAALALDRAGLSPISLVIAAGDTRPAAQITGDARLRAAIRVIEAPTREEGLSRALAEAGAPVLVAPAEVVADPALYRALAEAPLDDRLAVVACRGGAPVGPLLAAPALGEALSGARLDEAITAQLAAGRAAPLETGARWAVRADSAAGRRQAEDALLEACRKPVDGLVSRHLNRRVSLSISRRLAPTGITPNAVTAVTLAIALAGAIAASRGGYAPMLLGAALLQASSILDGVDGELARLRFQGSRLGQWLDTIADDLSTFAFYGGVSLAVARDPAAPAWLPACGVVAMAALALTSLQYYAELARLGSGDFYALEWGFVEGPADGLRARSARAAQLLLKRDLFTLLYLGLAAAGVLPIALVIAAAGHAVALAAATARALCPPT